jgi:hypothetical protein
MQTRFRLILGVMIAMAGAFGLAGPLAAQTLTTRDIAQRS